MKTIGAFILFVALATDPATAAAGLRKQCRKQCKPQIASCVATTGDSKRKCKKAVLRQCQQEGLSVCAPPTTTTTTTPPGDGGGGGGTGGGVMSLHVNDASLAGDEDPRIFTLQIDIKYSIVTADAVKQIGLDPAFFTVLDEDTDVAYPAEPAAGPEDCSADKVITLEGQERIACTLRFVMPLSVGGPSEVHGGTHAKLQFQSQGLRGSDDFNVY